MENFTGSDNELGPKCSRRVNLFGVMDSSENLKFLDQILDPLLFFRELYLGLKKKGLFKFVLFCIAFPKILLSFEVYPWLVGRRASLLT